MGISVTIRTRIRSESRSLVERVAEVEAAFVAAVGRALARSRVEVLAKRASRVRVCLDAPRVSWTGMGASEIGHDDRGRVEEVIRSAWQRAIGRAGLEALTGDIGPVEVGPAPGEIGEAFDPERYDPLSETYAIPSYQANPTPGAPTSVSVQRRPGEDDDFRDLAHASHEKLARALKLLLQRNEKTFDEIMLDQSEEGLSVLVALVDRAPAYFMWMFRRLLDRRGVILASRVYRLDDDFSVGTTEPEESRKFLARTSAVLEKIPLARHVVRERESSTPGLLRLAGLIEALKQVRQDLSSYLKSSAETTDPKAIKAFDGRTEFLLRYVALFASIAGTSKARHLLPPFLSDLIEDIRVVQYVAERLREIDAEVGLYRLLYGGQAGSLDEVVAILESRSKYVQVVSRHHVPTVAQAGLLVREANESYQGWQGRAGEAKLKKVEEGYYKLRSIYGSMPLNYSSSYGSYTSGDIPYNERLGAFLPRYQGVYDSIQKIKDEFGYSYGSESLEKYRARTARGDELLRKVSAVEQVVPLISIQLQLLRFWYVALDIGHEIAHHSIGDESDRRGWYGRLASLRGEINSQYDHPDYGALNAKFKDWSDRIGEIQKEINEVLKHEFYITLGIAIFATIVTFGVGAAIGGEVTVGVILAEAGTFTAVTTIGQAVLLDKPIDAADVVSEFVENAVMFGAFKVLGKVIAVGAKALAPGRVLAQLGITFGANTLVMAGIPIVTSLLETRTVSAQTETFVVANVLVSAVMTILGGARNVAKLRQMANAEMRANAALALDVATQLEASSAEAASVMKSLQAFLNSPEMPQSEFENLKKRAGEAFPKFKALLERLGGSEFSDEVLSKLGVTRAQVLDLADQVGTAHDLIQKATYNPPTKTPKVPPPSQTIHLVQTGPGTYEYNPAAWGEHPGEAAARLRSVGYKVTDQGGGVLRVTLPGFEGESFLLLPAGEPGGAEFDRPLLERVVGVLPEREMAEITAKLDRIFPELIKKLGTYPDEAALAALGLIVADREKLTKPWSENAVKGLAEMLRPERGVTRAAVKGLFRTVPPDQLPALFERYLRLISKPNTSSLADLVVSALHSSEDSERLIEVCSRLGEKQFKFPENMSRQAVEGLLRWIHEAIQDDHLTDPEQIAEKIAERFRKDRDIGARLKNLEAAAPRSGSRSTALQAEIDRLRQPIRPGINPLEGNPPQVVAAILERVRSAGGRFSDAREEKVFENTIAKFQREVVRIGKDHVELNRDSRGQISRANGDLNEIRLVLAALENGAEVFASGSPVDESGASRQARFHIDPSLFKLPGGVTVTNADSQTVVQVDIGYKDASGKIIVGEVSVGKLSLPKGLQVLLSGGGGSIDFKALALEGDKFSGEKFQQMIKLRAGRLFAEGLSAAFQSLSGNKATIPAPDMVVRVKGASANAVKAAELLGFRVEITGG